MIVRQHIFSIGVCLPDRTFVFFFFNDTATPEIYPLSLHDALPISLTSYLLFGSVSEPVTLVEGVFSLPPGHRMLLYVPERRRMPRARAWWDPTRSPVARESQNMRDLSSAAKCLRPLLEDAVRAHLTADVPVGLFLSSGLDSGAIAALAARAQPGICSFTLIFPGSSADESALAKEVARACGTRHREIPLEGTSVLSRVDEP